MTRIFAISQMRGKVNISSTRLRTFKDIFSHRNNNTKLLEAASKEWALLLSSDLRSIWCRASYSNPWATQLPTTYTTNYPIYQTQLILPLIAGGVDVDMDAAFRLGLEGPAVGLDGSSPFSSLSASIKPNYFFFCEWINFKIHLNLTRWISLRVIGSRMSFIRFFTWVALVVNFSIL